LFHPKSIKTFWKKVASADTILETYKGKEGVMFRTLVEKYGPEPTPHTQEVQDREITERVAAFFRKYRPNKLETVGELVEKWKGQEKELIDTLVQKYGKEPMPGDEAEAADTPAPVKSHRDRAIAIYETYNPSKVSSVDAQLAKNRDNEEEYIAALVRKYGPEPASTPTPAEQSSALGSQLLPRIEAMYAKYKPDKPHLMASIVDKYRGQEEFWLQSLIEKYGPEPSAESTPAADSLDIRTNETVANAIACDEPAARTEPPTAPPTVPDEPTPIKLGPAQETATVSLQEHEIFASYATSSPSVKQQLLLNFLNDREARLRDALSHSQRTSSTISQLRDANSTLAAEYETTKAHAKQITQQMESEALRERQRAEDSLRLWRLEKEELDAQYKVAVVSAQRSLNEARLQFEEERSRKAAEVVELRRRVMNADEDVRAMADQSSRLLKSLEQRQQECQDLREAVGRMQSNTVQIEHKGTQTAAREPTRSLEERAVSLHEVEYFSRLPTKFIACSRCSLRGAVFTCTTCRLKLCVDCDASIHGANVRFAEHPRKRIAPLPTPKLQNVKDKPERADDPEEQFDAILVEHDRSRATLAQYQDLVQQLELRIRDLHQECELLRNTGTAPSVAAEIEYRKEEQAEIEKAVVRQLTENNRCLTERIAGLELQLLAQPEACIEDADDARALSQQVAQLQAELSAAKASAKQYKNEIRLLRGRLQLQLSMPLGGRG
jgi:hypothetical protein